MMLEEKISNRLKVPYVEVEHNGKTYYLCNNGVIFAGKEYLDYADLNAEYERREKEDKLYDYAYAKSTGLLRKKRSVKIQSEDNKEASQKLSESHEEAGDSENGENISRRTKGSNDYKASQSPDNNTEPVRTGIQREEGSSSYGRVGTDCKERARENSRLQLSSDNGRRAVGFIIALLAFTSVISGYISTLQTATYLYDYVDMISSWLMSASVTAYNVTAFEVAVLFRQNKRYGLTFVFISLWAIVTLFSMATAVSVFYDRFNFNEAVVAEENRNVDSNKLALELLRTKESDLREAIAFKKKDIEYRQEKDYATATVRSELVKLENELQANLSEQQKLLSETPEVTQEVTKKKERLFAFLGRMLHVDSGVFEFIMSTLSAIFVNLIAPMSLVAVTELKKKKLTKTN